MDRFIELEEMGKLDELENLKSNMDRFIGK